MATLARRSFPNPPTRPASGLLGVAAAWHAVLGVLSLAALGTAVAGALPVADRGLGAWLAPVAIVLSLVGNAYAAWGVNARRQGGRIVSLVVNYLGLLVCTALLLGRLGIYVGLDAFGGTFARGLPALAVAGLAFAALRVAAVRLAERRGAADPARVERLRRVGLAVLGLGLAVAIWRWGILDAVTTLVPRLADGQALVLLAGAVLFALMARALWGSAAERAFRTRSSDSELVNGLLFVAPNLLGFLVFFAGPLLFSLFVSFTSWDGVGNKDWAGLDNYVRIFSLDFATLASADQAAGEVLQDGYNELFRIGLPGSDMVIGARDTLFWIAMRNIVLFAVLAVPLAVVPALFLASLLNSKIPGVRFFRAVYFIPSVAGVVGIAIIWKQLYNSTTGAINYFLGQAAVALSVLPGVELAKPQTQWLSDSSVSLIALVVVFAWQIIGFNTVLFLAGLQGVPKALYEAAAIDGAGRWQRFRNVTVPSLGPTTFFVVSITAIQALQLFAEPFILFNPPSGPSNSTLTPVVYLYQQGFQRFSFGYASAVAWVLFLVIFAFTLVQFRRERSKGGVYTA